MEFDYWDEDFCKDDVLEMTSEEKTEAMTELQNRIWDNEENNVVLKTNLKLLEG